VIGLLIQLVGYRYEGGQNLMKSKCICPCVQFWTDAETSSSSLLC